MFLRFSKKKKGVVSHVKKRGGRQRVGSTKVDPSMVQGAPLVVPGKEGVRRTEEKPIDLAFGKGEGGERGKKGGRDIYSGTKGVRESFKNTGPEAQTMSVSGEEKRGMHIRLGKKKRGVSVQTTNLWNALLREKENRSSCRKEKKKGEGPERRADEGNREFLRGGGKKQVPPRGGGHRGRPKKKKNGLSGN